MLTISGEGLLMETPEDYDITVDDASCDVTEDSIVTDDTVTCYLGDSSQQHAITNDGFNDSK